MSSSAAVAATTTNITSKSNHDDEQAQTKNKIAWIPVLLFTALTMAVGPTPIGYDLVDAHQFMCLVFVCMRVWILTVTQSLWYDTKSSMRIDLRDYDAQQFEREYNIWPSILVGGLELYAYCLMGIVPDPRIMPLFTYKSAAIVLVTHVLPVEFIYYWAHRIMHIFPTLYKHVHKFHHLSIVPTPKSAVAFAWVEHFFYDILFGLPGLACNLMGEMTMFSTMLYIPLCVDMPNAIIHSNVEWFPSWYLQSPLYYFFYCPSYHHVHHKYIKYNYALFMPIYDMAFGTYSEPFTRREFGAAKKLSAKHL